MNSTILCFDNDETYIVQMGSTSVIKEEFEESHRDQNQMVEDDLKKL